MSENSRLKIHTGIRPEIPLSEEKDGSQKDEPIKKSVPQSKPRREKGRRSRTQEEQPLTVGERLLRDTAIACALLLTVMALKNVDQPWSRQAAEGIRQAMTMRVDWDDTLGRLSFVRAIVPDTALVFLNTGERADLTAPVRGEISHAFSEQQPWIEYRCKAEEAVCAASGGVVIAAGQGAGGDWSLLIEREDGTQITYGYLAAVYVQTGEAVEAGQQIGLTANKIDSRLYFELRENEVSIDPTARLK